MVDALDERAVQNLVDRLVTETGRLDTSVNVVGLGDVQKPLREVTLAEFLQPITTAMQAQFITTSVAARHMSARRSGVILCFGGDGPRPCRAWAASRSPWTPWRACAASGPASGASTASGC